MFGKTLRYLPGFILVLVLLISLDSELPRSDPLTPEERAWLNKHNGKITLTADPVYPPIDFIDKNGVYRGLSADYVAVIEKRLGFKFIIKPSKSWESALDDVFNKRVDVLMSAHKTKERSKYLLFTKSFINVPIVIITSRKNDNLSELNLLKNKKIAVIKSHAIIEDFLVPKYPFDNYIFVKNEEMGLLKTSSGEVDAMLADLPIASYFIEKLGIANLSISGKTGYYYTLSIASRNDMPILNRILDKGLDLIDQEEKDAIYSKWIHPTYNPFYRERNFQFLAGGLITVFVLIMALIFIRNRRLRSTVAEKTVALHKELKEHKKTEDALLETEDKYRMIYNNSRDALMLIEPGGDFISGNPAALKLFECENETEISRISPAALSPKIQPDGMPSEVKAKELMRMAMEKGSHFFEWVHKRMTGEEFYASILLTRMQIKGEFFLQATVRDITLQKKQEAKLKEYSHKLEDLVEARTSELKQANQSLSLEITERKKNEKEREQLIQDLQNALAEVKTLRGFLPICSSCKRIRDDMGYWNQIESYLRDHSEAEFSHSICPECLDKLYPGIDFDKKS